MLVTVMEWKSWILWHWVHPHGVVVVEERQPQNYSSNELLEIIHPD